MKKTLAVAVSLLACQTYAGSSSVNAGAATTLGPSVNHTSTHSGFANPAMTSFMVPEEDRWRINYFFGGGFNIEVGDVNNFADDVDELVDILDDPNSTDDSASEVLDRFNEVLVKMGEQGYIKNSAVIHAPVTPLYYRSEELQGTFGMDVSVGTHIAATILDDELVLNTQNESFATNTSLYLKTGIETRVSFSYGRKFFEEHDFSRHGDFYAGVKLNLINLELSKQIKALEDFAGDDIEDVISDDYDKNLKSSSGFGVDVGVVWDAEWYRAGLTIENLNSPSFAYGDVGVNCEAVPENTLARNSCEVSRYFVAEGRVAQREEHTMDARTRVEGLIKLSDRWMVNSSLDLASYDDVTGFENQWFHLSTSYEGRGWWLPSARVGYQTNLTGSEVSSMTFGVTLFKALSLDLEYGLDTVEVDGSSGPRRLGFALAFEEKF